MLSVVRMSLCPRISIAVRAGTPYYYTAGPEGVEVLEIFRDADSVTVIYTDNPKERVDEAREALRVNADAWKAITAGPLYQANPAG